MSRLSWVSALSYIACEEQSKTTWKQYLLFSFDVFFFPWSHALSFVLERLTPVEQYRAVSSEKQSLKE
ncbi:hypothetical protein PROFUN_07322 [Planoprotostelium fungivorum]|uniref:Uncharacterized protein n=1 Tax=Planoprotostelium fungivorum TaxID=1890364 RepID=A0A2P6NM34_9EUKA|nr:hypothetical protein PROFUN_07322 [Planoprotostelium fungivorum]